MKTFIVIALVVIAFELAWMVQMLSDPLIAVPIPIPYPVPSIHGGPVPTAFEAI